MKTKTLLLLASLSLLTTVVRAAQTENEVVVMPTYTVEAPRYSAAERQINTSLDAARQLAKVPVAIPTNCTALTAVAEQDSLLAHQSSDKKPVRLAKS
jgi:hypothetical protein